LSAESFPAAASLSAESFPVAAFPAAAFSVVSFSAGPATAGLVSDVFGTSFTGGTGCVMSELDFRSPED
jgi:hypothetical protein